MGNADRDDRYDRPSWSERDKRRNRSAHRQDDERERKESRTGGTGYSKYKSELNRLFNSGKAGGHVGHIMGKARDSAPGEASDDSDGRAALVRAVRVAEGHEEMVAAVDALVAQGNLPDELEILTQVVTHPNEAIVLDALERIERLTRRNTLQRKAAFLQRLYTLEQTSEDPELRDLVNRLIEDLA